MSEMEHFDETVNGTTRTHAAATLWPEHKPTEAPATSPVSLLGLARHDFFVNDTLSSNLT